MSTSSAGPTEPLVLGIESSCDETGVALVRGTTLLGQAVASSVEEHARFGGVVPEVASRAHLEAMVPTLRRACSEAGVRLADVDAVAVTAGPGLAGALMVGVAAAKALALALDVPLYGVNHLVAHVAVDVLTDGGALPDPALALLVSGGHTELLLVRSGGTGTTLLGQTLDDAAGEAFDKVARLLGLPYPGGPHVQQFLTEVHFGDLDVLLLDMPPGTGDIPISVAQLLPGSELVLVTTPQPAAADVAQRAGGLALRTGQRVAGVVENMAWMPMPDGSRLELFGAGGGAEVARRLSEEAGADVPLLAQVPVDVALREGGDRGEPVVLSAPDSPAAVVLLDLAHRLGRRARGLAGRPLGITPVR